MTNAKINKVLAGYMGYEVIDQESPSLSFGTILIKQSPETLEMYKDLDKANGNQMLENMFGKIEVEWNPCDNYNHFFNVFLKWCGENSYDNCRRALTEELNKKRFSTDPYIPMDTLVDWCYALANKITLNQ